MSSSLSSIHLYRSLLRSSKQMKDYNFRLYAKRRIKYGFQQNRSLNGDEATAAVLDGMKQLELLKRQVTLSQLYPSILTVMETPTTTTTPQTSSSSSSSSSPSS